MEYNPSIERDFIDRTLKIIDQYGNYVPKPEQFEVTLLINCLLGLLVLPKELASGNKIPGFVERWHETLPKGPIKQLNDWGLKVEHIEDVGYEPSRRCPQCKETPEYIFDSRHRRDKDKLTLREVVKNMRHSTAHFSIDATGDGKEITHVVFSNKSGFKAKIPVDCLKKFVEKLAGSVQNAIPAYPTKSAGSPVGSTS